jgi:hypothetical protein
MSMSYDMSVDRKEGYILVQLHDELTKADIESALEKILIIRRQEKVNKILCNARQLQVPPGTMTIFDTARRFAGDTFSGMKLAIVRKSLPEGMHFFETVATNRSGIVRVFDSEEEANKWFALCR